MLSKLLHLNSRLIIDLPVSISHRDALNLMVHGIQKLGNDDHPLKLARCGSGTISGNEFQFAVSDGHQNQTEVRGRLLPDGSGSRICASVTPSTIGRGSELIGLTLMACSFIFALFELFVMSRMKSIALAGSLGFFIVGLLIFAQTKLRQKQEVRCIAALVESLFHVPVLLMPDNKSMKVDVTQRGTHLN